MNQKIEFKGWEGNDETRELIRHLMSRVEKKMQAISDDAVSLRLVIEQSGHKLYSVSLTVDVPGKVFDAKEERHDLQAALRSAFAEFERQFEAYKSTIRGEHLWKRIQRRQELRKRKAGGIFEENGNREEFFALIDPHLNFLRNFIRHEIAYAEAMGDLVPGEVQTEDLLDTVIVKAHEEYVQNPARGDLRRWLIRIAIDELDAAIKRSRRERRQTVHIEEDVPETPEPEEVSTLGDEVLDFYQPDEDLKLEDIVPDVEVPTPEQIAETSELRRCVRGALNAMPAADRRVLLLHFIYGFSAGELVRITGKSAPEIHQAIESARQYLRDRLISSGCAPKPVPTR